jgi:hypothetical protein
LITPSDISLRKIPIPELSAFETIAIGWWGIFGFVFVVLMFSYWFFKRITQKTALKIAQKRLKALQENTKELPQTKIKTLSTLIRRVAISLNSRSDCAGLTGQAWLMYLDSLWSKNAFNSPLGEILIFAPYQKNMPTETDLEQLILLTKEWLEAQR